MKHFFLNNLMIGLTAAALVTAAGCTNDEVHNDRDRDRSQENSENLPGASKPSEFTKGYDSVGADNNTITPDSNRYIGSQVDTTHGQHGNTKP